MIEVTLPWPPQPLKPNARVHYMRKATAAKAYRQACGYCCLEAGFGRLAWGGVRASIVFCPPTAARADLDNMLAAAKSGLDGVADVIGMDDSTWQLTISKGDPVKGGQIVLTLEPNWQQETRPQPLSAAVAILKARVETAYHQCRDEDAEAAHEALVSAEWRLRQAEKKEARQRSNAPGDDRHERRKWR